MEEVITQETLPDASQLNAADGGGADTPDSISLNALKEVLGKDFQDPTTALKSIKDTFNYVGDVGKVKNIITQAREKLGTDDNGVLEALTKLSMENNEVKPEAQQASLTAEQVEAIVSRRTEEASFFAENKDLAEIKDALAPLKNAYGKDMPWSEFVNTEIAKKVVEPVIGYKQEQAKKSVLESNPRLGMATDKLSSARSAINDALKAEQVGDVSSARQSLNSAKDSAVKGVMEAYGL